MSRLRRSAVTALTAAAVALGAALAAPGAASAAHRPDAATAAVVAAPRVAPTSTSPWPPRPWRRSPRRPARRTSSSPSRSDRAAAANPPGAAPSPRRPARQDDVAALKALGGDVVVATGGAVGPYLEHSCSTAAALKGAYEKVLDAVGSNHLDVDVEAPIPQDMVNDALAQLQAERGTSVSYTLRVQGQDYGVDPYSLQVLQSAKDKGVEVDVNPMLMNFGYSGDWVTPWSAPRTPPSSR
ncbi:hypothetical protein NKH77_04545 [Streptomyces sp. M19]